MEAPKMEVHVDNLAFTSGKRSFTLKEFSEEYKYLLPEFVIVRQGYFGENEMEVLGNGQILRMHSCVQQERAVAVDSQNRTLTIPTNYQLQFKVCNKGLGGRDKDCLKNVITKHGFPVDVQICDSRDHSFTMNSSQQDVKSLGTLTIKDVYNETYFLANAILNGSPQTQATLIPMYLKDIMIAIITGIEGQPKQMWESYMKFVNSVCQKTNIPLDTGLMEIAIYSSQTTMASTKASDNVYDYIEPSNYIVADWAGKVWSNSSKTVTKTPVYPPKQKPHLAPKPTKPKEKGSVPPPLPTRRASEPSIDQPGPKTHGYVNDVGRATVTPFSHIAQDVANKAAQKNRGQLTKLGQSGELEPTPCSGAVKIKDSTHLRKLSIDEVGEQLVKLKLEKHLRAFRDHGVDGELASELNESMLQEDFKFSKFDALKLMKFINTGHIPH